MNVPATRLDQIANEINNIWKNNIFEIGKRLKEAKDMLPHGQFIPWVEKNCPFNRNQAQKYLTVERHKDELITPPQGLGLNQAIRQLKSAHQMNPPGFISTSIHPPLVITPPKERDIEVEMRRMKEAKKEHNREFKNYGRFIANSIEELLATDVIAQSLDQIIQAAPLMKHDDLELARRSLKACQALTKRLDNWIERLEGALKEIEHESK